VAFAAPEPVAAPQDFAAVVALFEAKREGLIAFHLKRHARLARFAPGTIEVALSPEALPELATKAGKLLSQWTGTRWSICVADDAPATTATLQEQRLLAKRQELEQYFDHPVVRAVMTAFPDPEITLENL
jgi:DNA polymerase-3 subunit gamma/tau